ncbi:hypothetical protein Tco_0793675 [Tanacetum coccineum]
MQIGEFSESMARESGNSSIRRIEQCGIRRIEDFLDVGTDTPYLLDGYGVLRFLDNKLEEVKRMWNSIKNGPYVRPMIPNPDDTEKQILEPLSKMTEGNKKHYIADVKEQIKRLMFGSDVTSHVRHLRLMDEFDKFAAKERELLELVYERLTMLVNIMDRNNVRPIPMSINTKFLNCYGGNDNKNAGRQNRNQAFNAGNGHDDYHKNVQRVPPHELSQNFGKGKSIKDEAESILNNEENDFMLDTSYGEETMEELTDAEHNVAASEHNSNAHDPYHEIQILAYNVQREAANKKRLNNELSKQNKLLQKELETCYKNPERLKKTIAAQPKMYDGERIYSAKLTIDSPDSEETLEDASES